MKPIEVVVLGTSAMVPTKERNQSAVLVRYDTEGLLFDCGEGTQRQLQIVGVPANRITRIFITHWHGDHVLGLPGLMQTISAQTPGASLSIYGPEGTKQKVRALLDAFEFHQRLALKVIEITEGIVLETSDFVVEARELEHGVPCFGFALIEHDARRIDMTKVKKLQIPEGPLLGQLQNGRTVVHKGKSITPDQVSVMEKGRRITYIVDTRLCRNAVDLAQHADLLLSEAIYTGDMEEKADEYFHMTANQAAQLARQAQVKKLVLTHFSARYATTHDVVEDARNTFENVVAAHDLMKIKV